MNPVLEPPADERSLRWMLRNGASQSFSVGCGEQALQAYAVLLKASDLALGLLQTLPLFVGALAQVASLGLLDGRRSRRGLSAAFSAGQGLSWALIFALPLAWPAGAPALLLAAIVVYYVFGHLIPPIWNSWVGDLIPPGRRGDVLGRNARTAALFNVAGVAAGAAILETGRRTGQVTAAFGALFAVALAARVLSSRAMVHMRDVPYLPPQEADHFTFWDFLRRAPRSNFTKFVLMVAAIHGVSFLAAPFFTKHMLQDLRFSYVQLLSTSAVYFVAQVLTMHRWGTLCDRIGNRAVLRLTAVLLPVFPFVWLLSTHYVVILLVQAFAGFAWGGFSLAAGNFLFDAVTPAKRARCQAYFSVLMHGAMLLGGYLGGRIAPHLGATISIGGLTVALAYPIHALFLVSSLGRIVPSLLLMPSVREVRPVKSAGLGQVALHLAGIRPLPRAPAPEPDRE